MRIIVEGPDNSGKSTLIAHLSDMLNLDVVPGEGPAISNGEINDRVVRYLDIDNAIFDRHPCISQAIYNNFRPDDAPAVEDWLTTAFYNQSNFFIYCRGNGSLDGTVWRDVDDRVASDGVKHSDLVKDKHIQISRLYDEWALKNANYVYRIGDGYDNLVFALSGIMNRAPFDPVQDIVDFHRKFDQEYTGLPRCLPEDLGVFRGKFLQEELSEYNWHRQHAEHEGSFRDDPEYSDPAAYAFRLEHMLDALVDLVYVALGTAHLHGFNFREAWRRVQRANMSKVRKDRADADAIDSGRAPKYDIVKPKEWVAPSHIDLVEVNDLSSTNSDQEQRPPVKPA